MLNCIAQELPPVTHFLKDGERREKDGGGREGSGVQIEIGTPRGLGYFEELHVQVIEDFEGTVDFETGLLEEEEGKGMDERVLFGVGEALGVGVFFLLRFSIRLSIT